MPILGSVSDLPGLVVLGLGWLLLVGFYSLVRQGLKPDLRPLSGYEALSSQVGQAVESGGRVHVSLGPNSLIGEETGTALAGLAVLDLVADASSISDRSPVATTAAATTLPVMADTIRRAYRQRGTLAQHEASAARLVAFDPLALAGGATSIIADDQVRANLLAGSFGPEVALMVEAGNRKSLTQVVGSDRLEAQAVGYVLADHTLIGEELFVARAYVGGDAPTIASALAQDVLRWLVVGAIGVGLVLQTLGLLR